MSKTNPQHRNDAITAPPVLLRTHAGESVQLRPLGIGTLNLLQRVGNTLFTSADDAELESADMDLLPAILEIIYLLGAPLDEARRAAFGPKLEFQIAVQIFAESLELDGNFEEIVDSIADQKTAADAAQVVPKPADDDQDTDPNVDGPSGMRASSPH